MTAYWHDDLAAHPPVGTWMWHLHHWILCEPLTQPLSKRLAYIYANKPEDEIATRLACIDIIRGDIPAAYAKAWAAYAKAKAAYAKARAAAYAKAKAAYAKAEAASKAWAAYDEAWAASKAWAAYAKAWAAYDEARAAARPALEALHASEHPDCPWDGRTIFPETVA